MCLVLVCNGMGGGHHLYQDMLTIMIKTLIPHILYIAPYSEFVCHYPMKSHHVDGINLYWENSPE